MEKQRIFSFASTLIFCFHGYAANVHAISIKDAATLAGTYLLVEAILMLLFFFLLNSFRKAALIVFLLMSFQLFFGAFHDTLKKIISNSFFASYGFLIPFSLLFFILLFFYLRLTKRRFGRTTQYLNFLLALLVLSELPTLIRNSAKKENVITSASVSICDTCTKPNIYLILADEYAGKKELEDLFKFDNSSFENALAKRNFQILQGTRSNYNYTPYSMASLFSMNYIDGISRLSYDYKNRAIVYPKINDNQLIRDLRSMGYSFSNQSLFEFASLAPERYYTDFYSVGSEIISSQTFTARVRKDLWYHLLLDYKMEWARNNFLNSLKKDIARTYENTVSEAMLKDDSPKFVYSHFIMPHYPYLFNERGESLTFDESQANNPEAYIGYLKYGNGLLLKLIDEIIAKDQNHPIIILMSDHGYTKYDAKIDPSYNFMNMIHVYNSAKMPDSVTNVNFFRLLLNQKFRQSMPLLKDSTIYLTE